MSRMDAETWTDLARTRAERARRDDALAGLRDAGREALEGAELPGRKSESWKYSRIGALLEEGLLDGPDPGAAWTDPGPLSGTEPLRAAVVDGALRERPGTPDGLTVSRLQDLGDDLRQRVAAHLGTLAPASERPFVALNAALADDVVVMHVAAGVRVDTPLEVLLASADEGVCGAHPRIVVLLEDGARLTLIERQHGARLGFTNLVLEAWVGEGARLDHLRLGLDDGDGRWLAAIDVQIAAAGRYAMHQAMIGSAFRRAEVRIRTAGEGAHAEVGGASLTRGASHLDTQMSLEHEVAHCTSNQVFRAIAGDRSRTVLNGRIHIHRDAQKTAAELSSRNLLLSREAEIDAKPELEIYADDVTCAHGATVGRLDPEGVFYLRTRGIAEAEARTLLAFAFLAEVIEAFPVEAVRAPVIEAVRTHFLATAPAAEPATATGEERA